MSGRPDWVTRVVIMKTNGICTRRLQGGTMPELFVLEFDGFDKSDYEKVNSILGIDMNTGEGNWPEGLITHSAGKTQG
jgi:hypothetical protein